MKLLVFILAVLFVTVGVTLYALKDPGYVLIARAPWSVEMPLTLFIPLLIVAFFLFFALLYVVVRLVRIPRDVERWRTRRQQRRARQALIKGLVHLAEGNWVEAEKQLVAGMRYSDAPLLNHLGAAYAAQQLGAVEKRDEYLAEAHKHAPQDRTAVGMTQAYLQYLARQPEQSLATLTELRRLDPHNRAVLQLLARLYQQLRDWPGLVELLPDLRASNALPAKDIEELELKAHSELLKLSLPSGSAEVLRRAWAAVPRNLRRHPGLIGVYARQLIQQNEMTEAEGLLREAIERQWDSQLVELYGQAQAGDAAQQLETAEVWSATHPDDARLFLTLGRLAARAGEDAKARHYLEKSIALHGPADAYRELGELLERLGEKDKALHYYRQGLQVYAAEIRTTAKPARPAFTGYRAAR